MSCPQCEGIELTFDQESVEDELKLYRRDGVDDTTQWLIDAIRERGVNGKMLLDIGGGLGGIQHELLNSGAERATHVDASSAYIWGAKEEADRRGISERIDWLHGDFVELAPDLAPADIVTLDRVICCYPDMLGLAGGAAQLAQGYLGLVFPRDLWWTRIGFKVMNFFQNLFGHPFEVFVHPAAEIERVVSEAGLRRIFGRHSFMWQVALYARDYKKTPGVSGGLFV
ncbi:MAG: methyltransferase domain-containing protein [Chloroflexi bacterium]|nr:methyltransferase domain-containing protein [Chloroflexota bacterium]